MVLTEEEDRVIHFTPFCFQENTVKRGVPGEKCKVANPLYTILLSRNDSKTWCSRGKV